MHDVARAISGLETPPVGTSDTEKPLVVLSERLGPLTGAEMRLAQLGVNVASAYLGTHEAIASNGRDADLIIAGAVEPFDGHAIDALPRLKAIVRRGVGVDNVDVEAATSAGILVANVPDASVDEVSDHALAMLLALERRLFGLESLVRAGASRTAPETIHRLRVGSRRLSHLTLGIVGFGRIGAALANKAATIYRRIQVYDVVTPSADRLGDCVLTSLDDLLSSSDHISLHLSMSEQNRQLVGAQQISHLKPGAVMVNTARGGVIDEVALVNAIRNGAIAAAGLDVTEREPIEEGSILLAPDLEDRLILTAHSAAWSQTAATALTTGSVDAAAFLLRGDLPRSVVNPTVLDSPKLRLRRLMRARGEPPGDGQDATVITKSDRSGEGQ